MYTRRTLTAHRTNSRECKLFLFNVGVLSLKLPRRKKDVPTTNRSLAAFEIVLKHMLANCYLVNPARDQHRQGLPIAYFHYNVLEEQIEGDEYWVFPCEPQAVYEDGR